MKGLSITTEHFSHICVIESDASQYAEAREKLDAKVDEVLKKYPTVEIDPDFRCNSLTEVGLRGISDLQELTEASIEIVKWIRTQPDLKLCEI